MDTKESSQTILTWSGSVLFGVQTSLHELTLLPVDPAVPQLILSFASGVGTVDSSPLVASEAAGKTARWVLAYHRDTMPHFTCPSLVKASVGSIVRFPAVTSDHIVPAGRAIVLLTCVMDRSHPQLPGASKPSNLSSDQ